jgi:hypothetical protein
MDQRITIAASAAGTALQMDPHVTSFQVLDADYWPCIGGILVHPDGELANDQARGHEAIAVHFDTLAGFIRSYPDAPLEALYRFAAGQGIHQRPADGFDDIEPAFRIAYEVFRSTLLTADRVFADEEARAAAKARAAAVQAPVIVPLEDTILARGGGIMDRIGDAPEMVNLGGPVVAASTEGEGGDGEGVAGATARPGDDGGPAAGAGVPGAADDPGAPEDPQGDDVGRGEVPQAPADPGGDEPVQSPPVKPRRK